MSGDDEIEEWRHREDPREVEQWRTYTRGSISRLKDQAQRSIESRLANRLTTKLVVKSYPDVPIFHGIFVKEPQPLQRAFLSLCYYDPKAPDHYTWGEDRYCSCRPQTDNSSAARLLADAFDGFFGHRWPNATEEWRIESEMSPHN